MVSVFIVEHPVGTSREVGLTEALAIDAAVVALGLEVVGGSYALDGDARARAVAFVMGGDDGPR
jgi:hypothetical protein